MIRPRSTTRRWRSTSFDAAHFATLLLLLPHVYLSRAAGYQTRPVLRLALLEPAFLHFRDGMRNSPVPNRGRAVRSSSRVEKGPGRRYLRDGTTRDGPMYDLALAYNQTFPCLFSLSLASSFPLVFTHSTALVPFPGV